MFLRRAVGIDCRELTRSDLRSVGLIAKGLVEYLADRKDANLYLYSDVDIPVGMLSEPLNNISRGVECGHGAGVIEYQKWMRKKAEADGIQAFYQVNTYSLFKIRNCRTITTIHDLYPISGIEHYSLPYKTLFKAFVRATLRNSEVVTVPSIATKIDLETKFGLKKNVEVVYNGVDNLADASGNSERIISDPYIACVGRISHWKGTVRLLDIYSRYAEDIGRKLVLAGEPYDSDVKDILDAYTAENNSIIYLGYADTQQIESIYEYADLFCYPSKFEGFGIPPLEAASHGTKCLMNDIPVLRETTKNKGYYVDFYGPDELVKKAIIDALNDSGNKANELQAVARSYRWENFYRTIVEMLFTTC